MAQLQPRYSMEEFAHRGDTIYDRDVHPHLTPDDEGKYVLIDIESGDYLRRVAATIPRLTHACDADKMDRDTPYWYTGGAEWIWRPGQR